MLCAADRTRGWSQELDDLEKREVLEGARVVGMTTTGAAQLRALVQQLRPRIVMIEEAAEVLESHILAALHPQLEHLILIGDHKQLRPSTAHIALTRKYHMDVSMFERMMQ